MRPTPILPIFQVARGVRPTPYTMSVWLSEFNANLSIHLQRPHHPMPRRSPSPPRRYDRYIPIRSSPHNEPVWSNNYRPASPSPISGRYRADTPNPYLAQSPSPWTTSGLTPNPYRAQTPEGYFISHTSGTNPWDSTSAWQQSLETSTMQKGQPPSPGSSVSRAGRRGSILAKRMFEPSDLWKQSHADRREDA